MLPVGEPTVGIGGIGIIVTVCVNAAAVAVLVFFLVSLTAFAPVPFTWLSMIETFDVCCRKRVSVLIIDSVCLSAHAVFRLYEVSLVDPAECSAGETTELTCVKTC